MANQYNYATDIKSLEGRYTKYMVSRVVDNPKNKILQIETPTTLPEVFFLELMFYSVTENYLLSSITLTHEDTDVLKLTSLQYNDTSVRQLLFIDFSNVKINIEEGRLQLVIHFFVPEIGGIDQSRFSLTRISPSRTEIELGLVPKCTTEEIIGELKNFTAPQINSKWILDATRQIFNQPNSLTSENIPTDKTKLTFSIIKEYLPSSSKLFLDNADDSLVDIVETNVQKFMDIAYSYASQSIIQLNTEPSTRYTNEMFVNIVSSSISKATNYYTQTSEFELV